MKYIRLIIGIAALCLIAYNATLIDPRSPFKGDSLVAMIGIVSALCALLLLAIFSISKKIRQKVNNKQKE